VTHRAVDAELVPALLGRDRIIRERILAVGWASGHRKKYYRGHCCEASSEHESTFPEFAAFYAIESRLQLWKSRRRARKRTGVKKTTREEDDRPRPDMSGGYLPLAPLALYTEIRRSFCRYP